VPDFRRAPQLAEQRDLDGNRLMRRFGTGNGMATDMAISFTREIGAPPLYLAIK
jgi:hypothetical protein